MDGGFLFFGTPVGSPGGQERAIRGGPACAGDTVEKDGVLGCVPRLLGAWVDPLQVFMQQELPDVSNCEGRDGGTLTTDPEQRAAGSGL